MASISPTIRFDNNTHIEELLAQGADIKNLRGSWGETPLVYALHNGDKANIEKYLPLLDPNIKDYKGYNALSLAVGDSQLWGYIPTLISRGADANADYKELNPFTYQTQLPVEAMIEKHHLFDNNPSGYTKGLVSLLMNTNQKHYAREFSRPLLAKLLEHTVEGHYTLRDEFIKHYDFSAGSESKDNGLQKLLNSYYFDEHLYEAIFREQKAQLPKILKQKNKDGSTALHTYLDIFLNSDELDAETLPDSLFMFYREYLKVIYKTPKDEAKWNKFIETETETGDTIQNYISQSLDFEQERFKIIVEKHVLELKMGKASQNKFEDKKSFKI